MNFKGIYKTFYEKNSYRKIVIINYSSNHIGFIYQSITIIVCTQFKKATNKEQ